MDALTAFQEEQVVSSKVDTAQRALDAAWLALRGQQQHLEEARAKLRKADEARADGEAIRQSGSKGADEREALSKAQEALERELADVRHVLSEQLERTNKAKTLVSELKALGARDSGVGSASVEERGEAQGSETTRAEKTQVPGFDCDRMSP